MRLAGRVVAIDRLLLEHLNVLETLGPEDFLEFRDPLAPASGFQSRAVAHGAGFGIEAAENSGVRQNIQPAIVGHLGRQIGPAALLRPR